VSSGGVEKAAKEFFKAKVILDTLADTLSAALCPSWMQEQSSGENGESLFVNWKNFSAGPTLPQVPRVLYYRSGAT